MYYHKKIGECCGNDPEKPWKYINSVIGQGKKLNHMTEIKIDDQIISKDEEMSEAFNKFFIKIGPKLESEVTNKSINTVDTYLKNIDSSVPFSRCTNLN